jgi:hypothetical protein
MAIAVFYNAYLSIGGTDLSDHVKSVTLDYNVNMLDATVMGNNTKINYPGILDWSLSVEFLQDRAANKVEPILFPLVGNTTPFAISFKAANGNTTATNPAYNGNAYLSGLPIGGAHGDLEKTSVKLVAAGVLTRNTT